MPPLCLTLVRQCLPFTRVRQRLPFAMHQCGGASSLLPAVQSYERLEWLGDSVLELVVRRLLMRRYPNSDEVGYCMQYPGILYAVPQEGPGRGRLMGGGGGVFPARSSVVGSVYGSRFRGHPVLQPPSMQPNSE